MSEQKSILPEVIITISVLAVSTGALFIRFAQREASSLVVAAYRLGLGTLFLTPFALFRYRQTLRSLSRGQWRLALLSGLFLALHFGFWITSLEYTTVASSVVLVCMSPLLVAILSTLLLHEPLTRQAWIGLAVALAGSAVVAFSQSLSTPAGQLFAGSSLLGNLMAFAGAIFIAGYLVIGRKLRAGLPLVPYAFVVFGTAAVLLTTAALLNGEKMGGFPPITYVWFLALGLIPQILGHAGFNWALGYLPASFVSIALLGEPIGSSLFALFLLKEIPSAYEIIGGVMILSGIYLSSRNKRA